jgi:hypothetical protein
MKQNHIHNVEVLKAQKEKKKRERKKKTYLFKEVIIKKTFKFWWKINPHIHETQSTSSNLSTKISTWGHAKIM